MQQPELMAGFNDTPTTVFTDQFSEEVWQSTYKDHNDNHIDNSLSRTAKFAASAESTESKKKEWEGKFYDMLSQFKCTAGGRIYANAGTEWGGTTLLNCFVSPRPDVQVDSLAGIVNDVLSQCQTLKSEGGWGQNFSFIRPRGAFIGGIGVETPGAVKYMEVYDKTSDVITSGSGRKSVNKKAKGKIRKGAMMGVLDVWHPDIIEFITAKQQPGRLTKFNISVNCTDQFMERVARVQELIDQQAPQEQIDTADQWTLKFPDTTHPAYDEEWDGDIHKWERKGYAVDQYRTVSAMWLWNLMMESTYNRAEPGVLFLDRANHFNPLNYAETIFATNPSMPMGTLVHTKEGIFPIEQLENKEFYVKSRDGKWAPASCCLSGENEELLEISFGANRTVQSTKEHRWPVYDPRMQRVYKVDATNLKPGDMIPLNRNEELGICGDLSVTEDEGFLLGYFVGDGWCTQKAEDEWNIGFVFSQEEYYVAERVCDILNGLKKYPSEIVQREETGEYYIQTSSHEILDLFVNKYGISLQEDKHIPSKVWESNDNFIRGFVDGLLSADGCVFHSDTTIRLCLTTSRERLAKEFGKLLSFTGVPVKIWYREVKSQEVNWPNGKTYDRDNYQRWDVSVDGKAIVNFSNVFGLSHDAKRIKLKQAVETITDQPRNNLSTRFAKVKSICPVGAARVWDISVNHNEHVFPTEWCYTGNCGEQTLAPGGVCNLGSINLTQFVKEDQTGFDLERIETYTTYLNRFLDNINSLTNAPLDEYVDSVRYKRRVGIGILGWGSALFMLKTRFGSDEAAKLREQVMETIAKAAYRSSIDLAEEKGMFKYCEPEKHARNPFIQSLQLENEYMDKLRATGIRNSSLLSIQPTGNTSILANVTSGGLEPIFMPEYVRTVIVGHTPDDIVDVTPNWNQGEWYETEMFKFEKEGDEDILKGTAPDGTVYKIDQNRGLTKEVLCQDYGVRWLSERDQWDPNADWAITALDLSVQDHVNDVKGFARWVDSAMSKTVNVPHDYSFEGFKDIYLQSYASGYVKGVTTYRSGTMTTVLSAKEEKDADATDEEIIAEDVKLPDQMPASMTIIRAENKKWYLTTVMNEQQTRPVAFFVHTNSHEKTVQAMDAVEKLLELAHEKGIPEQWIYDTEQKLSKDSNATKIARAISLLLRHGVLIKHIVTTLDRVEDAFIGSFVFQIRKYLSTYIKEGEKIENESCPECGGGMMFSEGCKQCIYCSNSRC